LLGVINNKYKKKVKEVKEEELQMKGILQFLLEGIKIGNMSIKSDVINCERKKKTF